MQRKNRMKTVLLLLLIPFFLTSCSKEAKLKEGDDFKRLMGDKTAMWKFVQTAEDRENLTLFQKVYEQNKNFSSASSAPSKIPKVLHFIWLGPHPFPKESIKNINSWVEYHPDWVIKFWTDKIRPLPNRKMELHLVSDFSFQFFTNNFIDSDNYAEKSDLLRYEILYQEGGVYVDHDVECFTSFTPLNREYDLFCGLEPPHEPVLSSSISVCNNIIGARQGHPVLQFCIERVQKVWCAIGEAYPNKDRDSIVYRVARRTFSPFDEATKLSLNQNGNRDMVFPAAYFNRLEGKGGLYAHHYYASTWFANETVFEQNVRRRLNGISRKNNQILLFNAVILGGNILLCSFLFIQFRSLRAQKSKQDE